MKSIDWLGETVVYDHEENQHRDRQQIKRPRPPLQNITRRRLDKVAKPPQIGIRLSPKAWIKPITSVAADSAADRRAGQPTVKKNMSVPKITAVLMRPARDAGHIK